MSEHREEDNEWWANLPRGLSPEKKSPESINTAFGKAARAMNERSQLLREVKFLRGSAKAFDCPDCGELMIAPPDLDYQRMACPHCGTWFTMQYHEYREIPRAKPVDRGHGKTVIYEGYEENMCD